MLSNRAKYAPIILKQAKLAQTIATRMMVKEEKYVEKAIEIGKSRVFHNHTFQFSVEADGFYAVAKMAEKIAEEAKVEIDQVVMVESPQEDAEENEEEIGYQGRTKQTAYSKETLKKQAFQLRVIRHAHAKKTVHFAYALKRTLARMKRIDAKIRKAKETSFFENPAAFKEVIGKLDQLLKEAQPVADSSVPPPLPSEE